MKIIILEAGDVCQYENCEEPATAIACGRELPIGLVGHPEPNVYCSKHAREVVEEDAPVIYECCPNCACKFSVC